MDTCCRSRHIVYFSKDNNKKYLQNKKTPLQNTITKLGHNIKSELVTGTKFKRYSKINEITPAKIKQAMQ